MANYITGLTGADEGDGLRPTFLQFFFCEVNSTLDVAYSAIYDRLQFHFDVGKPMVKILQLLCTRCRTRTRT